MLQTKAPEHSRMIVERILVIKFLICRDVVESCGWKKIEKLSGYIKSLDTIYRT